MVLYRDGVREVQDGVGDFMEPGQVSSEPGETPEELSTDLRVSSSWGVRVSRAGQAVNAACQEHSVVFSLIIILSCMFSSLG